MSLKAKLGVAFVLSLAMILGLAFLLRSRRPGEDLAGARPDSVAAGRAAPGDEAAPAVAPGTEATPEDAAGEKAPELTEAPAPAAPRSGWTIRGRLVRPALDGGPGAVEPVEGATIELVRHPRRTKPEDAPPPQKVVTAADGVFELKGVPPDLWLRVLVDAPSCFLRALGFRLPPLELDDVKDLGDVLIGPAETLRVRLVGPRGEPVGRGEVLAEATSSSPVFSQKLSDLGFRESRRAATETAKGEYTLDRMPSGPVRVDARAPGYAPSPRTTVQLPLEEPLTLVLEEGTRIAGVVQTLEGKPVADAELEADGPGPGDPHKTTSDRAGRFAFDTIEKGEFEVSVRAQGFAAARLRNIEAGAEDLEMIVEPEAMVSGTVTRALDGTPVAGAKVSLEVADGAGGESAEGETDEEGRFTIGRLVAGIYVIEADHPDLSPEALEPKELAVGQTVSGLELRLEKGLTATGAVVDAESGAAIPDARVHVQEVLEGRSGARRRSSKSGEDGAFEVRGLHPGPHELTASARGYFSRQPERVVVEEGADLQWKVALERGGSIAGRILDRTGTGIAGASVQLGVQRSGPWPDDELGRRIQQVNGQRATTEPDGSFTLEGLPAFEGYTLLASHRSFASGSVTGLALQEKEPLTGVEVSLLRGGTIRGKVLDADGAAVAGATVAASVVQERAPGGEDPPPAPRSGPGRMPQGSNATSGPDGRFILERLLAGAYSLTAQARGLAASTGVEVELADEEEVTGLEIKLGVGEALRGVVVDADGAGVEDVSLFVNGSRSGNARTGRDGRFELRGLERGTIDVIVQKSGFVGQSVKATLPGPELRVTLERMARIAGRVTAEGLEQLKGFEIAIFVVNPNGQEMQRSSRYFNDPDGAFDVEVQPGEAVLVQARVPTRVPVTSERHTLAAGERREGVDLRATLGGRIEGLVLVRGSGEPIAGADISVRLEGDPADPQVRLQGWSPPGASSGPDGSFKIEGIPPGTVTIDARHGDYAPASHKGILIVDGAPSPVTLELGLGGTLQGHVRVAGVEVVGERLLASRTGSDEPTQKQVTTSTDGSFELKGLPPGDYEVRRMISSPRGSFRMGTPHVTVVYEGQMTELEIDEAPPIVLSGRVFQGGVAFTSGSVQAQSAAGFGMSNPSSPIDPTGRYEVELPGPGTYRLMVMGRGAQIRIRSEVVIPEGASAVTQDIDLPSGRITGVVVDAASGARIPGAQVVVFAAGGRFRSMMGAFQKLVVSGAADESGAFAFEGIEAGDYEVHGMADGFASARATARVPPGGAAGGIQLALERGSPFEAQVVDSAGRPVDGAMAVLRDELGQAIVLSGWGRSGPDGRLQFRSVKPGAYELTVARAGFAPATALVDASPGVAPAVLRLEPGGALEVRATDSRGGLALGCTLRLVDEAGRDFLDDLLPGTSRAEDPQTTLGSRGQAVLRDIRPGAYRASIALGQAESRPVRVTIRAGETASVELALPR